MDNSKLKQAVATLVDMIEVGDLDDRWRLEKLEGVMVDMLTQYGVELHKHYERRAEETGDPVSGLAVLGEMQMSVENAKQRVRTWYLIKQGKVAQ